MSCHHADTTTIAWLYGEGDAAHADHVAQCEACSAVAAVHTDVISTAAPLMRAVPPPALAARATPWLAIALVAAGTALVLWPGTSPQPAPEAPAAVSLSQLSDPDALDLALDELQGEVAALSLDFEIL